MVLPQGVLMNLDPPVYTCIVQSCTDASIKVNLVR